MMTSLFQAVQDFASRTCSLSDRDLDRPWNWKGYEEGVRFSFFRLYEELSQLAARLEANRAAENPQTTAQRILAQYHSAYRDLQAVLLGVNDALATQIPAEGEWPLREVLVHIIQADRGFFTISHFGLEQARKGAEPFEMSEGIWNEFWAQAPFAELSETGSLAQIQAYHAALHPRILAEFAGVGAEELQLPLKYWEEMPLPLEFRLHRFHSHMRQHTIQAEKTLEMLKQGPAEAKRLLRMIFTALAAVENTAIGAEGFGQAESETVAAYITDLGAEIAPLLG